jgi:hypothetical protein
MECGWEKITKIFRTGKLEALEKGGRFPNASFSDN